MNVAIITTVDHNIGDDFVREGIKYLLTQYFKGETLTFESIHKHVPITARRGFERARNNRIFSRVDKFLPLGFTGDRIREADLVVQSGAPVYWCHTVGGGHCADNEWFVPLIRKRFVRNPRARFINLAAGTCQRYHSDGTEFLNCEKCRDYIRELYELSTVTTVRDTLAQDVLRLLGIEAPVIPCSSIFAIDEHGLKNEGEEYVVVNYMQGGAHYTFGQNIDFNKWEDTFKTFYFELKKKEKVIFSCHNEKEVEVARTIDPGAEIFYQKDDYLAYMKFYARAKFGIMNRVHGAFLMASYGKPSIVIGNDSRARMVEEIGLESIFVNDVDVDILNDRYEYLKAGADNFKERFAEIKRKAYDDYMKAFSVL
jgi:hypothetical protein